MTFFFRQHALLQIIAADEQGNEVIGDLSVQTMVNGIYANPQEQMKLITQITAQDVQQVKENLVIYYWYKILSFFQAAKKILSSKLSVAAYGSLHDFPRLANISV